MSNADKTSTFKLFFSEKESAGKDSNNVNNIDYATHIKLRNIISEPLSRLFKVAEHSFQVPMPNSP